MLKNRYSFASVILIVIILFIYLFGHNDIYIQNAITLEPATDFGVEISIWRILFEPILGVMLFLLRSQAWLAEPFYMFVWFFVVYLLYSVYYTFRIAESNKIVVFLRKMLLAPAFLIFYIAFILIIVVAPLPANRIVNNAENTILVNTHSHSDYSHDGLISQENLRKWHKRNNFDAFFITDHGHHKNTLEYVNYLKEKDDTDLPVVMVGEEYSGSNHITILGLDRDFDTKGYSDARAIDSAHAQNGVAITAHWFQGERNSLEYYRDQGVDGFEIEKQGKHITYNRDTYASIKSFASENNLIMNGAVDYHGHGEACFVWNAFEIPGWNDLNYEEKEESILSVIRNREQDKLKVLIYRDREYYYSDYLWFSPVLNFYSYFRSLNFYQILSWIVWIIVMNFMMRNVKITSYSFTNSVLIKSLFLSLFILLLGLNYRLRIPGVSPPNEIYEEYSNIMLILGFTAILYFVVVLFYNIRKTKS